MQIKYTAVTDLHYASLHPSRWLAAALRLSVWQQPSHPPSNSLFLMPWWFSASEGLFCSIQRGNHGNGSLTLGALLQQRQAWPEFLVASWAKHTWLGRLTCFSLLAAKKLLVVSESCCSWISSLKLLLALRCTCSLYVFRLTAFMKSGAVQLKCQNVSGFRGSSGFAAFLYLISYKILWVLRCWSDKNKEKDIWVHHYGILIGIYHCFLIYYGLKQGLNFFPSAAKTET